METVLVRFEVKDGNWIRSFTSSYAPLPRFRSCDFSFPSFEASISQSEDSASTTPLPGNSMMTQTPSASITVAGEESRKAEKPSVESDHGLERDVTAKKDASSFPKRPSIASSSGNIKQRVAMKASNLFTSAKGTSIALSQQAMARAQSMLAEVMEDGPTLNPPVKRKNQVEEDGPKKKQTFRAPLSKFRIPFRKSTPDVNCEQRVYPTPLVKNPYPLRPSDELRRATYTGPSKIEPSSKQDSLQAFTGLQPRLGDSSEMPLPESPLLQVPDPSFDSSAVILPTISQNYAFDDGKTCQSLHEELTASSIGVTLAWAQNHYRWIIWSFSRFGPDVRSTIFTSESTFGELKYRYVAECRNEQISCLVELMKKESASIDHQMILLVAGILSNKEGNHHASLELSDGWTSARMETDLALQTKLKNKKIEIGTLLAVHGVQIIRRTSQAPISFHLIHNHCVPAPVDSRIGICEQDQFFVPLGWIDVSGGSISNIWLCILRKYPICYKHKMANGRFSDFTPWQHEQKMKNLEEMMEAVREEAHADVKQKQLQFFKAVLDRKKEGEEVDELEWLFAKYLLDEEAIDPNEFSEKTQLDFQNFRVVHEKSFKKCVEDTVTQLLVNRGLQNASVSSYLDLLVSEVTRADFPASSKTAQLRIWIHDAEEESKFCEGDVFQFKGLSVGCYPSATGILTLRTSRETSYQHMYHFDTLPHGLLCHFSARAPAQDLSSLKNGELFDFVGSVVKDADSHTLLCTSAESQETEETQLQITLLEDDPLQTVKAGDIVYLKDVAFGSFTKMENSAFASITYRTNFHYLKKKVLKRDPLKKSYVQDAEN